MRVKHQLFMAVGCGFLVALIGLAVGVIYGHPEEYAAIGAALGVYIGWTA